MNLHEYQGKEILAQHGVNVQRGVVLDDLNEIENVKKQVQIGLLSRPRFMLVEGVKVVE